MTTDNIGGQPDRRVNLHIRAVFDSACRVTAPFFDPKDEWGGQAHTMYARQALHDAFPDMTQQDIALLFAAVRRHHQGLRNQ